MQQDKFSVDDTSSSFEKKWSVVQCVDRHYYPIAAGHATSMNHQETQKKPTWHWKFCQHHKLENYPPAASNCLQFQAGAFFTIF